MTGSDYTVAKSAQIVYLDPGVGGAHQTGTLTTGVHQEPEASESSETFENF